jgi:hypothetical protein
MIQSLALVGISQSCGPVRWVLVTQPEPKGTINKDGSKTVSVKSLLFYEQLSENDTASIVFFHMSCYISCAAFAGHLLAALFQTFS